MNGETILIIEDDEKNTKLLRAILERENYTVISAAEAESGIDLAKRYQPILILMDIQLPGTDGLEATRILKDDPMFANIPIVGVSAHAMEEDFQKAMKAGCCNYITKPIDIHSFLQTVNETIENIGNEGVLINEKEGIMPKKILVVDDNPLNVKLFSSKLKHEGYDTIPAYTGQEALEKISEEFIDIVLLDLMMPVMDGFEVLERLKSEPATKNIPVIVITAMTEAEERLNKLEVKADELLTKPVSTVELVIRVKSMVHLREIKDKRDEHIEKLSSQNALGYSGEIQEGSSKQASILIIEDDDKDATIIEKYLSDLPYNLMRAKSGQEAFSLIEDKRVDIILLDIMLPDTDGFKICSQLKSSDATKDIQIIAVTSVDDLDEKERSIKMGMDEYLIKPVSKQELRIRIKSSLSLRLYAEQINSVTPDLVETL